tara:strand:+ start:51492 stop:52247 length:756 start_codon:yes stop_codon:yes gene_type:complete
MTTKTDNGKKLKVLIFDIETAPNIGYTWTKWETNVIEFITERYMLCFAAKWLDEKQTVVHSLPDFKGYTKDKTNDKELVKKLWALMDEADVVVAHNGDKFDIKVMNARFAVNGLTPPSPYKTVDTCKVARGKFGFNSNKLNDLGKVLGFGGKFETGGFALWKGCMAGEKASWTKMKKYNKIDVTLLEKVYLALRPWMPQHPNVGINKGRHACNHCASTKTQNRGFSYAKVHKYQRYQCQDCYAWGSAPIKK